MMTLKIARFYIYVIGLNFYHNLFICKIKIFILFDLNFIGDSFENPNQYISEEENITTGDCI